MEEVFDVVEPKSERSQRADAIAEICRRRWELEIRAAALQAEIGQHTVVEQDLRERLEKVDFQQRELLKSLAKVVDDCDDTLQVESLRLNGSDPDDPMIRQARKWYRKVDRTRQSLTERLNAYGVAVRDPVGVPSPDLDTVHSTMETDAVGPGEIVKVLRPGLLWNGTILRRSLVVVAAGRTTTEESEPPSTAV